MIWTDGFVPFSFGKCGSGVLANCLPCDAEAIFFFSKAFCVIFLRHIGPCCVHLVTYSVDSSSSRSLSQPSLQLTLPSVKFSLELAKSRILYAAPAINRLWTPLILHCPATDSLANLSLRPLVQALILGSVVFYHASTRRKGLSDSKK